MSIDKIQPLTVDIIDDNNLVETNTRRTFYSQDKETAIIRFQVRENGKEFDFGTLTDATASVAVRTADRSLFELTANITNAASGIVEVIIPQEVLLHEGKAEGELYIDSGTKRNATVQFSFKIKLSLIDKNNLDIPVVIEALDAIVERVISENPEKFVGEDGKSAYQLWIEAGNEGTLQDYLISMKGKDGISPSPEQVAPLLHPVITEKVSDEFSKLSTAVQHDVEVILARDSFSSLDERLDNIENRIELSANKFGADTSATWQVNRDAIQQAIDEAVKVGGVVTLKAGTYTVKGIQLDNKVTLDLTGVILKNPDGLPPSVITNKIFNTTGSITTGSNILNVVDASNISEGNILVVKHAGGMLNTQFTALTNSIDATTTSITINQNNGKFPYAGYFICGTEIIKYSSITDKTLNGVERGALGTTATSHNAGDFIGVARHQYVEVTKKNGNALTLNEPAVIGVSNVEIDIGIIGQSIINGEIDANKIKGGTSSSVYGIEYRTSRWANMIDVTVKNGDMGGIFLGMGATENNIVRPHLHNCGVVDAASPKGAGMWMFQGCKRNHVTGIKVTGEAWVGTYIDDRTSVADPYDAPNYDNIVMNFVYDTIRPATGYPPAFIIVGSSRNKFINGFARGTVTGVEISYGDQVLTEDGSRGICRDNEVAGVHFDVQQPWILSATGNRLHECTYTDRANSVPVVSQGNLVYAVTTSKGNPVEMLADVKFGNGTASKPAISFVDDLDSGFYKDSDNVLRLALGGQLKYSWYGTEFRLADAVNLTTGTVTGTKIGLTPQQKIGFFGRTPTTQPLAIADLPATGFTDQQVRDATQMLIVAMRNLGLISMT